MTTLMTVLNNKTALISAALLLALLTGGAYAGEGAA